MATTTNQKPFADGFLFAVLVSVAFHFTVILFFTVKLVFFPQETKKYIPAIKVDMVALPEKYQRTPKVAPKKEKKSLAKKKKKTNKKSLKKKKKRVKAKSQQKDALTKIQQMAALEKLKGNSRGVKKKVEYKGNILNAGTELRGVHKIQHENYQTSIDRHVKKFWVLPEWMAKTDYKVRIKVNIDKQGYIVKRSVVSSSGNSTYDKLALDTVQKASPFPPPPKKFVNIVLIDGIILGFPE